MAPNMANYASATRRTRLPRRLPSPRRCCLRFDCCASVVAGVVAPQPHHGHLVLNGRNEVFTSTDQHRRINPGRLESCVSPRAHIAGGVLLAVTAAAITPASGAPQEALVVLHGQVTNERGKPLAGAYISVTDPHGNPLGNGQSADDGRYEVRVASAARYEVWAGKSANIGYQYIPQSKSAQGLVSDFQLQPGANLVLAAYDLNGRRLTNGEFRHVSGGRVFATDLADNPAPSALAAVPGQNASDWRWDSGGPQWSLRPASATGSWSNGNSRRLADFSTRWTTRVRAILLTGPASERNSIRIAKLHGPAWPAWSMGAMPTRCQPRSSEAGNG